MPSSRQVYPWRPWRTAFARDEPAVTPQRTSGSKHDRFIARHGGPPPAPGERRAIQCDQEEWQLQSDRPSNYARGTAAPQRTATERRCHSTGPEVAHGRFEHGDQ